MLADLNCAVLDRTSALAALWIWREAATWLEQRSLPLWPPELFDERFIDEALRLGCVIGASFGRAPAGVAVLQWTDELWWPDRPSGEAGFVHKVAVARAFAGRGVAAALVRECERQARARGRTILRLDTAADRPALRALYERLGFVAVDLRSIGSFAGVRYEKVLR